MCKEKTARPRGTDSAKIISVIETEAIAGYGIEEDPVRPVKQYWSLSGELLAVSDPCNAQVSGATSDKSVIKNPDGTVTVR